MKKIYILLLFIFSPFMIFAQSNAPDSLITSTDSLQVISPIDSLLMQMEQDSFMQNDTLDIDTKELKKNIDSYIDIKNSRSKEHWFNWWYLSANKHYTSLKQPLLLIRKDGFTQYPHFTESMHILQSEIPFYNLESSNYFHDLSSNDYLEPAMLSYAEAGMGDWRHSRGTLSLKKGNSPISDSLAFSAAVSGINGFWFGNYETSANINLNLLYRTSYGNYRFIHTTRSEEIPAGLTSLTQTDQAEVTANEEIIKFENDLLEAGIKYDISEIASNKREISSLLLRKQNSLPHLDYDISAELLHESHITDSTWISLTSKLDGNYSLLSYNWVMNYSTPKSYFINSNTDLRIYDNYGLTTEIYAWKNDSELLNIQTGELSRMGAGISYNDSLRAVSVILGEQEEEDDQQWYLQTSINSSFNWKRWTLLLRNWTFYYIQPDLQSQTEAEIKYNLNYGNKIRLQYRNRYHSTYLSDSELVIPDESWHDLMLGIQITRKFEIRLELINITNNIAFAGEQQSGFTMLYNLTWFFIN